MEKTFATVNETLRKAKIFYPKTDSKKDSCQIMLCLLKGKALPCVPPHRFLLDVK